MGDASSGVSDPGQPVGCRYPQGGALRTVRSVLAGYRPMDLAPLGVSTVQASRESTYADRRRAAAERLSVAAELKTRLDAAVDLPVEQSTSPIDPDGVL